MSPSGREAEKCGKSFVSSPCVSVSLVVCSYGLSRWSCPALLILLVVCVVGSVGTFGLRRGLVLLGIDIVVCIEGLVGAFGLG